MAQIKYPGKSNSIFSESGQQSVVGGDGYYCRTQPTTSLLLAAIEASAVVKNGHRHASFRYTRGVGNSLLRNHAQQSIVGDEGYY